MQNGDGALPSIILAGRALLVKMLIILEPHDIFASNFVYLCTSTLFSHWHAKQWRGFAEHHFDRSRSFSENAYNSWTTQNILIKFCILIHFDITYRLPYTAINKSFLTDDGFAERQFKNLGSASENAHNSWTLWYIHFKFCILMYFNIVQPLPC